MVLLYVLNDNMLSFNIILGDIDFGTVSTAIYQQIKVCGGLNYERKEPTQPTACLQLRETQCFLLLL